MLQKYHYIHERGDYPPLAIEEIASAWSSSIKETVKFGESPLIIIYKDRWCRIYSYEKVHQKIVNYVFQKISKDRKHVTKIKKIFNQRIKEFLSFVSEIKKIDWHKFNTSDLIKIKEKYIKLYHQTVPYGEPLPYFLKEKLQTVLDKELLKKRNIKVKEYEILMTPLYQSFLNRESKELWEIIRKYKAESVNFKKEIKKHKEKYQWILFDYASLTIDEKYLQRKAKEFLKNPPKFLDYKMLKRKKQEIIKRYKVAILYRYYLNLLEDLFYLMDRKKEILTQGHFAINFLHQELARRLNLDLDTLRWFFWREIKEALIKKKKLDKKLALSRKKFCVVKFSNGKVFFLDSREIRRLVSDIKKDEEIAKELTEIQGIPASPGRVKGKVCYLKSARENSKIKKGEILLTSNTTPDFMPAIQKAKAIITNEGGLTCHAAIVSRELKIPCIVGTKIATKVLKDGDLVEVDAEKGIVKILKRSR